MHFKHPEIHYFLFLLIIPILVHLFQLRRFKKEYFTNVRFLKELSVQTRKSSKLKKWLLLATRCLILTALVIAFAQPFFEAKDRKNTTNEMYILLDNSFSMQAKGQKGELLRRAVEDLLEHTPENQNFTLLTTSGDYWNTDIRSIRRDLQNLEYSATPFRLDNLMAKVKAKKTVFNKDLIVITDGGGLEDKQLKSIDPSFNTYFILPKAEQKNNASVDSIYISQVLDNFYEIGVKLSAYGESDNEIPVALYNNAKLIAKTQLKFDTNEKTLNFTIPKADFNGYVSIDDNGLRYDNELYFSITKPAKTNVMSIGEAGKSNFLSRIFSEDEFNFANFEANAVDYNTIDSQDAIVLNELKDIPQALQTTLKSFVAKGGNLVVVPAAETPESTLNTFLSSFGNIKFSALRQNKKLITKIAFSHPLYQAVFEKKADNFQYPETNSDFSISSSAPFVLGYEDQSPFLLALQQDVASVYVFSAPLNKQNSNFQNAPLIVPTFYNMAQSRNKTGVSSFTIGESQPYIVDAQLSKDEIITLRGKTEKFIPVQQIMNNKVKLTFGDYPQKAGNYGIYSRENLVRNIGFNYARTESNTQPVDNSILSAYKVSENAENIFDTLQADRTDNEIWKLFIILALLFLITELCIQKFVK